MGHVICTEVSAMPPSGGAASIEVSAMRPSGGAASVEVATVWAGEFGKGRTMLVLDSRNGTILARIFLTLIKQA
jgi:hypothetical protein